MGYMPEQPAFYAEMRVREHLEFICGLKGICKNKKTRAAHIEEVCERVGIFDVKERMIRNLSKGYRQRVGFAGALIGEPEVIILDEPTAGLDPAQTIEMRKLIKDCAQKSTVIVSSHVLPEIQSVCNRVIVISEGRIIADGTPESLASHTGAACGIKLKAKGKPEQIIGNLRNINGVKSVEYLQSVKPDEGDYSIFCDEGCDIREDVFHILAKEGLPILEMYSMNRSLEDAFIKLTDSAGSEAETEAK
jgi:ABC-2 type transport system ATP-binding protein